MSKGVINIEGLLQKTLLLNKTILSDDIRWPDKKGAIQEKFKIKNTELALAVSEDYEKILKTSLSTSEESRTAQPKIEYSEEPPSADSVILPPDVATLKRFSFKYDMVDGKGSDAKETISEGIAARDKEVAHADAKIAKEKEDEAEKQRKIAEEKADADAKIAKDKDEVAAAAAEAERARKEKEQAEAVEAAAKKARKNEEKIKEEKIADFVELLLADTKSDDDIFEYIYYRPKDAYATRKKILKEATTQQTKPKLQQFMGQIKENISIFNLIKDKYNEEKKLLSIDINKTKEQIKKLPDNIKASETEAVKLQGEIDTYKSDDEAFKSDDEAFKSIIQKMNESYLKKINKKQLQKKKDIIEAKITAAEETIAKKNSSMEQLRTNGNEYIDDYYVFLFCQEKVQKEIAELEKEIAELEREKTELEKKTDKEITELQKEIQDIKNDLNKKMEKLQKEGKDIEQTLKPLIDKYVELLTLQEQQINYEIDLEDNTYYLTLYTKESENIEAYLTEITDIIQQYNDALGN